MKALTIAWKDTLIRFRDRNALLLMLLAPLVISGIMGAAFGDQAATPTISNIPLVVVNQDQGVLGQRFIEVLNTGELMDLLEPKVMADLEAARDLVETGNVRALVLIPADFSVSLETTSGNDLASSQPAKILIYTDPAARISPTIVRTVVTEIANVFSNNAIASEITAQQVLEQLGSTSPALVNFDPVLDKNLATLTGSQSVAELKVTVTSGNSRANMNPIAFFAPSMAIFFLMFTMFDGTRSILVEQANGTMDRLKSTPTGISQILLGKLLGTFLTGTLQFVTLVVASSVIFGLSWGSSIPGLALMLVAFVAAATAIGALVTAFSKDLVQANLLGSMITLLFGFLGGNFFMIENFPQWLQIVSKMTINRWGIDGFSDLTVRGLGIQEVLLEAGVLLGIALVCFSLAAWRLPRRFVR
ncbi:MAG: ABC transporter permease [Herpetosiphonaceae bacterium]|nr:ABC transporter permease [Herpetosiphonaceae bacterium]